eukprot:11921108-Karenia_brevis.AAC.1
MQTETLAMDLDPVSTSAPSPSSSSSSSSSCSSSSCSSSSSSLVANEMTAMYCVSDAPSPHRFNVRKGSSCTG